MIMIMISIIIIIIHIHNIFIELYQVTGGARRSWPACFGRSEENERNISAGTLRWPEWRNTVREGRLCHQLAVVSRRAWNSWP